MASGATVSRTKVDWQVAETLEQEIRSMTEHPNPSFDDLDRQLTLLRIKVKDIILQGIRDHAIQQADALLWDVTCAIKAVYQKSYAKYKGNDQRKFAVEKQRTAKRYADWIKISKIYYKASVQELNSIFHVPAFRQMAQKLENKGNPALISRPVGNQAQLSPELYYRVIKSLQTSLLHLGDLSRYRNEVVTGEKNWQEAAAYYGMAGELMPEEGASFHQMAWIALAKDDHLDTVYCLYRALVVEHPHLRAKPNLELEFKKLTRMWGRKETISSDRPAETAATTWFLKLHVMLYKSETFAGHDHMETEFIYQTTNLIKDQSIREEVLNKFALINIAAEFCATQRFQDDPSLNHQKSYLGLVRLNVRSFFMLLSVLLAEIRPDDSDDLPGDVSQHDQISPVMMLILPTLRHYSIWLVSRAEVITNLSYLYDNSDNEADSVNNLTVHLKEMWRQYASTLCLLIATFSPKYLATVAEIGYLLKEDSDTIGFRPLADERFAPWSHFIYKDIDDTFKPHVTGPGVAQEPRELEMLHRIRQLIRDGATVALRLANTPIRIGEGGWFFFTEDGVRPTNGLSPGHSMSSLEMKRELSERDQARGYALGGTIMPDTEYTHTRLDSAEPAPDSFVDQQMNDMVAHLVGGREDSDGMKTRAADEFFASGIKPERLSSNGDSTLPQANQPAANSPTEPQYSNSTIQSGQLADARALDEKTGGGIHAHGNQPPKHSRNVSSQDAAKKPSRSPFNANMTESEKGREVQRFLNPFSSIFDQNSSIHTGTPSPINNQDKSRGNTIRQDVSRTILNVSGHQGHSSAELSTSVFESSLVSNYGDSRSYEREILLQYQQMGNLTPRGPQG